MISYSLFRPQRLYLAAAAAMLAFLLGGCSAVTSTTNTAADVARTATKGMLASSRASTDASVTEPNTPRHRQAVAFVDSQRDPLSREAATGGGEHIDALASLLGDGEDNDLGPWMQAHYGELFADDTDAAAMVDRIAARRG
ncbi:hypothetical protein SADO_08647 [Salinisphaera dokdonensis CL-ES53]|uniref:Lipoprotein n=1 Tax=Salinisphaera dokdonensis CL-ES53 TaxID=1304272 RepID=A0ABV2B0A9_9GAMM